MKLRVQTRVLIGVAACLLAGCGSSSSPPAAASVNGQTITMADYNLQVHVKRAQSQDSLGYDACQVKSMISLCHQIESGALESLIQKQLVREYAAAHHISVPQADVDRQWAIVYRTDFHSEPAVLAAWAHHSGLKPDYFKKSIADDLLQSRVMAAVTKTVPAALPSIRLAGFGVSTLALAREYVRRLRTWNQFISTANTLAQIKQGPCASAPCGDRGWIPLTLIPPSRASLKTARPGHVLGPFANGSEYDLYYIEQRSAAVHLTPAQLTAVREQQFSVWLQHQEHRAAVKRYVTI